MVLVKSFRNPRFMDRVYSYVGAAIFVVICWSAGRYSASTLWLYVLIVFSILTKKLLHDRHRRYMALRQTAAWDRGMANGEIVATELPSWVQFPDVERVEWMNKVLQQAWPYIGEFAEKFLKEVIESKIRENLPKAFRSFMFQSIDVGDVPVRIGGLKVYTSNVDRDKIVIDMEVSYAGDCEFNISVGMFTAGVRDIQFRGKLRCQLRPLMSQPPWFGGIALCFLDFPMVDFDMTGVAGMADLPGLTTAVHMAVNDQLMKLCILPNEIVIPLTHDVSVMELTMSEPDAVISSYNGRMGNGPAEDKSVDAKTAIAEGAVTFDVVEARNLENKDQLGKSDPYVRVKIGIQSFKTKTIQDNLNPKWRQSFAAVVDQANAQRVIVEVFDEDTGFKDDYLGGFELPLSEVRSQRSVKKWFPLEFARHGDLLLSIQWFDLCRIYERAFLGSEERFSRTALLMVYLHSVKNLPKTHRVSEPSSFVQFSVDDEVRTSTVKEKTSNPVFQQKFSFLLSDVETQFLKVEAKDAKRDRSCLGQVTIPVKVLVYEKDLELLRHPWQLALGPYVSTVILSLKLRVMVKSEI